jgi:hypothetical protein
VAAAVCYIAGVFDYHNWEVDEDLDEPPSSDDTLERPLPW